jgi:hypothetical protein
MPIERGGGDSSSSSASHSGGLSVHPSTIIYAPTRKEVEALAQWLVDRGVCALAYHAGLKRSHLDMTHRRFSAGTVSCVVATIAFGMVRTTACCCATTPRAAMLLLRATMLLLHVLLCYYCTCCYATTARAAMLLLHVLLCYYCTCCYATTACYYATTACYYCTLLCYYCTCYYCVCHLFGLLPSANTTIITAHQYSSHHPTSSFPCRASIAGICAGSCTTAGLNLWRRFTKKLAGLAGMAPLRLASCLPTFCASHLYSLIRAAQLSKSRFALSRYRSSTDTLFVATVAVPDGCWVISGSISDRRKARLDWEELV